MTATHVNGMTSSSSEITVSIIIVNYNTHYLLRNCLTSIRNNLTIDYEAIIVDNASTDGSVELCMDFRSDRRYRFIHNETNLGFARANNIGAEAASGRILHFLNPDTEIPSGMSDDYIVAASAPTAVYVNMLANKDGKVENSRMPVPNFCNLLLWDLHSSKAEYWYRGASIIISHDNFIKIGRWCEDYFLYSEDLDFFLQCQRHSIEIKALPSLIFHLGGGSSKNAWDELNREIMVQKSTRLFFKRNFRRGYFASQFYLLLHILVKHPSKTRLFLQAWKLSRS